jgi:hypothetical protein
MQKFAAMVGSSALFALVVLAVLEPAAGFAGPHALLPLRARSVLDPVSNVACLVRVKGRLPFRAAPPIKRWG